MSYRQQTHTITGTSATSASTTAVGNVLHGLDAYDWITITAILIGSTNGAVDCCLQFKNPDADEWWDWIRFPQVSSGTTAKYQVQTGGGGESSSIVVVGSCTTASPAITLAANTSLGGRPTGAVRLVVTAGAGTDSGATQTVDFHCWRRPK